jgi:hypothetical protein
MNVFYAKSILYSYKSLNALMAQMDDLVEKKALSSISDLSPCEAQCEKILAITDSKDVIIRLKIMVENALSKFTEEELDYFDYKYFKQKPKEYYKDFDATNRAYFRTQIRLAEKFALRIERAGVTDAWFRDNCLSMDFFKGVYKNVMEKENASTKTKEVKALNYDKPCKKSA